MSLLLPVFVRGINNLSDARYCAGMGADGLIFTLDPTLPGALPPAALRELTSWVAGVEIIGEFGAPDTAGLNEFATTHALDRVLLRDTPDWLPGIDEPLAMPVLRATDLFNALQAQFDADLADDLAGRDYAPAGCQLLLDLPAGFDTESLLPQLAQLARQFPLWLGGAITPELLPRLLSEVKPAGLVLQGGDELKPGLRDFEALEAVFEALEAAE